MIVVAGDVVHRLANANDPPRVAEISALLYFDTSSIEIR